MQLNHVALRSRSEENADRFYGELLGLSKQAPKTLDGALSKRIFSLGSETAFAIVNYTSDRLHFEVFIDAGHIDQDPISHVCIDVGDLDRFLEKCRDTGVTVRRIPKGEKIVTFIEDFDGNLFEITGG